MYASKISGCALKIAHAHAIYIYIYIAAQALARIYVFRITCMRALLSHDHLYCHKLKKSVQDCCLATKRKLRNFLSQVVTTFLICQKNVS